MSVRAVATTIIGCYYYCWVALIARFFMDQLASWFCQTLPHLIPWPTAPHSSPFQLFSAISFNYVNRWLARLKWLALLSTQRNLFQLYCLSLNENFPVNQSNSNPRAFLLNEILVCTKHKFLYKFCVCVCVRVSCAFLQTNWLFSYSKIYFLLFGSCVRKKTEVI